jgi:hypothetical protein
VPFNSDTQSMGSRERDTSFGKEEIMDKQKRKDRRQLEK